MNQLVNKGSLLVKANMDAMRSRMGMLAAATLLGLSVNLVGCNGQAGAPGVNAPTLQPTGTIQGRLRDSTTLQPIVGARINIGVASATTDGDGQYVMTNVVVPVDSANNGNAGLYYATINMRGVTSPVNMGNATATPRYADFAYKSIPISFTPLYVAAASAVTATPVTGLIATSDFTVGKLAATIVGVVGDSVTKQNVGAGYIVTLVSQGSNISGLPTVPATGVAVGTGASGELVATTTTNATGNFTFANVESKQTFIITATSPTTATQSKRGVLGQTALADGRTTTGSLQIAAGDNNNCFDYNYFNSSFSF